MYQEYISALKRKLKGLERLINSSKTPEDFLLRNETPPSVELAQSFLRKYPLKQVIKAQMYNHKNDFFYQNSNFGFVLELEITTSIANELTMLLNIGYPEETYLNFFVNYKGANKSSVLFTVITKLDKQQRVNHNLLASIRDKIIKFFKSKSLQSKIVNPKSILSFYNQVIAGYDDKAYTNSEYIFEQIIENTNNQIDNEGVLTIHGINHYVFYTKQYPNVSASEAYINPFITILEDFNDLELDYYYSVNIKLDKNKDKTATKIYSFITTLILIDANNQGQPLINDFQDYFRYKHNWLIYLNRLSPLQQFINSLPLQFDQSVAEALQHSSINQKYPVSKLAELLPIGALS